MFRSCSISVDYLSSRDIDITFKNPGILEKTALYQACQNGHVEFITRLLKISNIDTDEVSSHGDTPFHVACVHGNVHVLELLCNAGVDIEKKTGRGSTPFIIACRHGHLKVIEFLLYKGIDPNIRTSEGYTGLHVAYINNHFHVIKYLLEAACVNINTNDNRGKTILHLACEHEGNIPICEMLIRHGADKEITDEWERKPLSYCPGRKLNRIRGIIDDVWCTTDLHRAIYEEDLDMFHQAIHDLEKLHKKPNKSKKGGKVVTKKKTYMTNHVNELGWNCLHIAVLLNRADMLEILLDKDVDILGKTPQGHTILHLACSLGNANVLSMIIAWLKK